MSSFDIPKNNLFQKVTKIPLESDSSLDKCNSVVQTDKNSLPTEKSYKLFPLESQIENITLNQEKCSPNGWNNLIVSHASSFEDIPSCENDYLNQVHVQDYSHVLMTTKPGFSHTHFPNINSQKSCCSSGYLRNNEWNYNTEISRTLSHEKPCSKTENLVQTLTNSSSNSQQVKTKLRSIWNNMKYGWRIKREVHLKLDSATWLLGRYYHNKLNDSNLLTQDVGKELKLDFASKIWLTYRLNFPAISGTDMISDTGWGCMLRCGQMMMAQALVCHLLSRDWRISEDLPVDKNPFYRMILRFFGDSVSHNSPFSLHHLVSFGKCYGRKAGDWYGPTHAAQVLRDALNEAKQHHNMLKNICMYVALDGIVFKQDVLDICLNLEYDLQSNGLNIGNESGDLLFKTVKETHSSQVKDVCESVVSLKNDKISVKKSSALFTENCDITTDSCSSYSEFGPSGIKSSISCSWTSLILFVSVRLGNDKMNPFYIPCLKSLLAYEHCIGIIGGRPKHALYFIGWQDDKLIHMDPHSCQPTIDVDKEDFNVKSFHSSCIRTISFSEMDPSCAIGFYFKHKDEYENFIEKFSEITAPMRRNLDYPVFALAEGKRIDIENIDSHPSYSKSVLHPENSSYKDDDDEYIML